MTKLYKVFNKIDTVHGFCEECEEDAILVAIVSDFIDAPTVVMIPNSILMDEYDICHYQNLIENI